MGLDLPKLAEEGLIDMLNVSPWLVQQQESDLPRLREALPNVALYYEMTNSIHYELRRYLYGDRKALGKIGRLATAQMYTTTALQAYDLGADGVSFFNFVYTRPCRTRSGLRAGVEPPFQLLAHAADRAWLARQPQHYFLATRFGSWTVEGQLPAAVAPGKPARLSIHVAPQAKEAVRSDAALLRVEVSRPVAGDTWRVRLNAREVPLRKWQGAPFAHFFGDKNALEPGHVLHCGVPRDAIRAGANDIEVGLSRGKPAKVVFLDLAVGSRYHPLGR